LKAAADKRGVTMAQVAIAWVLSRGDKIVPIPGTKRRSYLEQNAAAVDITLSEAEIKALDEAFPPHAAAGLRYPEFQLKMMGI
jgi:aryl-alcohol dehydrogenase-like predicted oxidoreductase